MASSVNLDQVEAMAAQLPPTQRLKLAARICEDLRSSPPPARSETESEQHDRQSPEALADSLRAGLDAIAEGVGGQFDSAEDIRHARLERAGRS